VQSTGGWFSGWFGSKQAAVEVQTVGRFPDFWHCEKFCFVCFETLWQYDAE